MAIHEAARQGDLTEVQRLVQEDASLVQATDDYGDQPLALAANSGHLAVVLYLVDQVAPIDHPGYILLTALHWACLEGHLEVVRRLLERGADRTLQDGRGDTPLAVACRGGHVEVMRCLLDHGGSPLDSRGYCGGTALLRASQFGQTEVIRLLLQHGADPTIPNQYDTTPLAAARYEGHEDCVALLEVSPIYYWRDEGVVDIAIS